MDIDKLETKFARIGARLRAGGSQPRRWRRSFNTGVPFVVDIQTDRHGEYFEVATPENSRAEVEVLDVQPGDRHLLLLVRDGEDKHKFLCGHDERHWFVAAVPESAPVGTVKTAKEALKPAEVKVVQARAGLGASAGNRRKNAAFRRQGEWFFVPAEGLKVDPKLVLRNEPLRRGAGKPHWADFCYRFGGQSVYVCSRYPNGLDLDAYRAVLQNEPKAERWGWTVRMRDACVYVKGRVRHADHRTIMLHGWHRVFMNTETQSRAMRNVAFLD